MKFSPEGGLSSAKLEGQNITSNLCYLRESDFKEMLSVFGFRDDWPDNLVFVLSATNNVIRQHNLAILTAQKKDEAIYEVVLCRADDTNPIYRKASAILLFNINEKRFVDVVSILDSKWSVIRKLLD